MMPPGAPLRVLVVDDSVVFRMMISRALTEMPGIEVVGVAHNGRSALEKVRQLTPDLVTLDIEMPDMDGLQVLKILAEQHPDIGVVMVSASDGEDRTIKALEIGAFDFVLKPSEGGMEGNRQAFSRQVAPLVRSYARMREIRTILNPSAGTRPRIKEQNAAKTPTQKHTGSGKTVLQRPVSPAMPPPQSPIRVIAVGVSTGGPMALATVLPTLPGDIGIPILIVQHMPAGFTRSLAESLDRKCALQVREAVHGERLIAGSVYIAPGGSHMKVVSGVGDHTALILRMTNDPPENGCRPSADVLFRSVADSCGAAACAVIMTGMGRDGARGARRMKEKGARIIAQDEASSTVFGMAKLPMEWGIVDVAAPLAQLGLAILGTVGHPGRVGGKGRFEKGHGGGNRQP